MKKCEKGGWGQSHQKSVISYLNAPQLIYTTTAALCPQSVLTEFVQIEMMFHARALKYLSKCYEAAQRIDGEADMEVRQAGRHVGQQAGRQTSRQMGKKCQFSLLFLFPGTRYMTINHS